jgi:hypothetical protein
LIETLPQLLNRAVAWAWESIPESKSISAKALQTAVGHLQQLPSEHAPNASERRCLSPTREEPADRVSGITLIQRGPALTKKSHGPRTEQKGLAVPKIRWRPKPDRIARNEQGALTCGPERERELSAQPTEPSHSLVLPSVDD